MIAPRRVRIPARGTINPRPKEAPMLVKNYSIDAGPLEIIISEPGKEDVVVKVMRMGGRTGKVGIKAPRSMKITFNGASTATEAVEKAVGTVLEGDDDNA